MKKVSVIMISLVASVVFRGMAWAQEMPSWHYMFFNEAVPLELDVTAIALLEDNPSSGVSLILPSPQGTKLDGLPTTPIAEGWSLVELDGSPSAGDPQAIVDLIEGIAQDPTSTSFATPVFIVTDDISMIVAPTLNVGFDADVPLSVIEMTLESVGAGEILVENWLGIGNVFQVDGNSRSGIEVLERANTLASNENVIFSNVGWLFTGNGLVESELEPNSAAARLAAPSPFSLFFDKSRLSKAGGICSILNPWPPQDALFPQSWGLEQVNDIDIDALDAWSRCAGSTQIRVAILDDGVEPNHPDLPNLLAGADVTNQCLSPPCIGQPQTECDIHGTTVAGVAGAAANNLGSLGIGPNISILSVRIGGYSAPPFCYPFTFQSWIAEAVIEANTLGADVTNLSWNFRDAPQPSMALAYESTYRAGTIHFNSAGNNDEPAVWTPGSLPEVNSISGIQADGSRFLVFDGYGSNYGEDVFLAAPARDVITTDRTNGEGFSDATGTFGDHYVSMRGTSFAAPFVAGTAALLLSCRPELTPYETELILQSTATDLGVPGRDDFFGHGLVNAGQAVTRMESFLFADGFEVDGLGPWSVAITE